MAMTLMDMLSGMAGSQMQQAGNAYGLDAQQSQQAVGALLPAISSAMKQNMSTPQGMAGLLGALQNGGHAVFFITGRFHLLLVDQIGNGLTTDLAVLLLQGCAPRKGEVL